MVSFSLKQHISNDDAISPRPLSVERRSDDDIDPTNKFTTDKNNNDKNDNTTSSGPPSSRSTSTSANANDGATSRRPSSIDPTSLDTPLDSSSSSHGVDTSLLTDTEFCSSCCTSFTTAFATREVLSSCVCSKSRARTIMKNDTTATATTTKTTATATGSSNKKINSETPPETQQKKNKDYQPSPSTDGTSIARSHPTQKSSLRKPLKYGTALNSVNSETPPETQQKKNKDYQPSPSTDGTSTARSNPTQKSSLRKPLKYGTALNSVNSETPPETQQKKNKDYQPSPSTDHTKNLRSVRRKYGTASNSGGKNQLIFPQPTTAESTTCINDPSTSTAKPSLDNKSRIYSNSTKKRKLDNNNKSKNNSNKENNSNVYKKSNNTTHDRYYMSTPNHDGSYLEERPSREETNRKNRSSGRRLYPTSPSADQIHASSPVFIHVADTAIPPNAVANSTKANATQPYTENEDERSNEDINNNFAQTTQELSMSSSDDDEYREYVGTYKENEHARTNEDINNNIAQTRAEEVGDGTVSKSIGASGIINNNNKSENNPNNENNNNDVIGTPRGGNNKSLGRNTKQIISTLGNSAKTTSSVGFSPSGMNQHSLLPASDVSRNNNQENGSVTGNGNIKASAAPSTALSSNNKKRKRSPSSSSSSVKKRRISDSKIESLKTNLDYHLLDNDGDDDNNGVDPTASEKSKSNVHDSSHVFRSSSESASSTKPSGRNDVVVPPTDVDLPIKAALSNRANIQQPQNNPSQHPPSLGTGGTLQGSKEPNQSPSVRENRMAQSSESASSTKRTRRLTIGSYESPRSRLPTPTPTPTPTTRPPRTPRTRTPRTPRTTSRLKPRTTSRLKPATVVAPEAIATGATSTEATTTKATATALTAASNTTLLNNNETLSNKSCDYTSDNNVDISDSVGEGKYIHGTKDVSTESNSTRSSSSSSSAYALDADDDQLEGIDDVTDTLLPASGTGDCNNNSNSAGSRKRTRTTEDNVSLTGSDISAGGNGGSNNNANAACSVPSTAHTGCIDDVNQPDNPLLNQVQTKNNHPKRSFAPLPTTPITQGVSMTVPAASNTTLHKNNEPLTNESFDSTGNNDDGTSDSFREGTPIHGTKNISNVSRSNTNDAAAAAAARDDDDNSLSYSDEDDGAFGYDDIDGCDEDGDENEEDTSSSIGNTSFLQQPDDVLLNLEQTKSNKLSGEGVDGEKTNTRSSSNSSSASSTNPRTFNDSDEFNVVFNTQKCGFGCKFDKEIGNMVVEKSVTNLVNVGDILILFSGENVSSDSQFQKMNEKHNIRPITFRFLRRNPARSSSFRDENPPPIDSQDGNTNRSSSSKYNDDGGGKMSVEEKRTHDAVAAAAAAAASIDDDNISSSYSDVDRRLADAGTSLRGEANGGGIGGYDEDGDENEEGTSGAVASDRNQQIGNISSHSNSQVSVTGPSLSNVSDRGNNINSFDTATTDTNTALLMGKGDQSKTPLYKRYQSQIRHGISTNLVSIRGARNKFTAVFVCPVTGERFFSGFLISGKFEGTTKNGLCWYNKKEGAESAAAGVAEDNFSFRKREHINGYRFCRNAPYDFNKKSTIESTFIEVGGDTIRVEVARLREKAMQESENLFPPPPPPPPPPPLVEEDLQVIRRDSQRNKRAQKREQKRLTDLRVRDAEGTGAIIREVSGTSSSSSGDSVHCLAKALKHILIHIARTEGTYPKLKLDGETIPVTRSGEQPSIDVYKIENELRRAFLGGTTQTGYATLRDVKDVLRDYFGFTVHLISQYEGGESRPGLLGLTAAPVLVICNILHKNYKDSNKETKKEKISSHALALVQNDNGCNTLYDGDEQPVDLTTDDMKKYKDYAKKCKKDDITGKDAEHSFPRRRWLLRGAKKVFEMCHGKDYSSEVRRSFFIQRKKTNQNYRTDEEEEEGVLDFKMILSPDEN